MPAPVPFPVRLTIAMAGLAGAVGVVAAASASHDGTSRNLSAVVTICLAHAPVLLALGLWGLRSRTLRIAALLLGLGTLVFVSDLLLREWLGQGAFPLAAPIGGVVMIGGWLAVILGGLLLRQD